jgi:hypothetical protein
MGLTGKKTVGCVTVPFTVNCDGRDLVDSNN